MALILKQIGWLLGALAALYGVLLALTLLLVPREDAGGPPLDTARAPSSLFMTQPKYVFMARDRLNTTADKAILLGASNMLAGFSQPQVQARVTRMEIHNLSVGGSNITQIGQIVDLVREVQSPAARRHNTYVIGLWYGLFADDRARWYTPDRHAGDTDIDIERYRYGFYRRTGHGAEPLLPPRYLSAGVTLIHPYLALDRLARDLTRSLRTVIAARPPELTDAQRDAVVVSATQRRDYLAFWRTYMDDAETLDDAPFHALERIVDGILAEGGRVILVDMPIPRWHTAGAPLAADYRRRADALFAALRPRPGVAVLAMSDDDADDDFSDEVHPKPRVGAAWAQRLAAVLNGDPDSTPAPATDKQTASPSPQPKGPL